MELVDPQDLLASPLGWHDDSLANTTFTRYVLGPPCATTPITLIPLSGNNVVSFTGRRVSGESSPGLNFNVAYNDSLDPQIASNAAASRINAFYIANTVHDFAYRYGFTEQAFNFQFSNFGKGGQDGDLVLMSVQDASGFNNANFASPPE